MNNRLISLFAPALLVCSLSSGLQAQQKDDINYAKFDAHDSYADIIKKAAAVKPSKRQLRWQQLELTGFLHFGINTFTGREWGDGSEDPRLFNPTNLDARQWVSALKEAGIKQVIITAKHHDGFCLWPSKYTEHSVKYSPWKNGQGDVVREVANACKELHVGFGIYLSPWDRNSPLYGTEQYNDFFVNQLTELLTNYGKVDEVWFDGANGEGPNGKKQRYDFDRYYQVIRKLQPEAVIAVMGPDVRWVGTETGYGRDTEWSVVPADNLDQIATAEHSQQAATVKPQGNMKGSDLGARDRIAKAQGVVWYPAEADVSIRPGWFYHPEEDAKVRTPEKLEDIYFNSVGKNGVLLLNVPPDKEGRISKADVVTLQAWNKLRTETFVNNLAAGARITCPNGKNLQALTDNDYNTYFETRGADTTCTINIDLKAVKTFDVLLLQEQIAQGQHVEQFQLEYKQGDQWVVAAKGTTIGYKRLLRFPAISAQYVRLVIGSARTNPALAALGLYKQP